MLAAVLMTCRLIIVNQRRPAFEKELLQHYLVSIATPEEQLDGKPKEVTHRLNHRHLADTSRIPRVECLCPPRVGNASQSCALAVMNAAVAFVPPESAGKHATLVVRLLKHPMDLDEVKKVASECPVSFWHEPSFIDIVVLGPLDAVADHYGTVACPSPQMAPGLTVVWNTLYSYNPYHNLYGPAGHIAVAFVLSGTRKLLLGDMLADTFLSREWIFSEHVPRYNWTERPFLDLVDDLIVGSKDRFTTNGARYTSCTETHILGAWQRGSIPEAFFQNSIPPWMWWEWNRISLTVASGLARQYARQPDGPSSPFLIVTRRFEGAADDQQRARGMSFSLIESFRRVFSAELGAEPDIDDVTHSTSPRKHFLFIHSRRLIVAPEGAIVTFAFLSAPGTTWIVVDRYTKERVFHHSNFFRFPNVHSHHVRIIIFHVKDNVTPTMLDILSEYRRPFMPGVFDVYPRGQ